MFLIIFTKIIIQLTYQHQLFIIWQDFLIILSKLNFPNFLLLLAKIHLKKKVRIFLLSLKILTHFI
jgi:hypothetical protein